MYPNHMNDDIPIQDTRPTRADAVHNRALLLDTAQELFRENGVDAVSMTAIAQAAGVGKGTLYRHFENKTELCQALLDSDQQSLQNRTLSHLRTHSDPLDNLRWFVAEVLAFINRNYNFLSTAELTQFLEHPAHIWWRRTIAKLLEQLHPPGDVEYIADVLYIMLDIRTIVFQRQVLNYDEQRIHDGITATLLKLIN